MTKTNHKGKIDWANDVQRICIFKITEGLYIPGPFIYARPKFESLHMTTYKPCTAAKTK